VKPIIRTSSSCRHHFHALHKGAIFSSIINFPISNHRKIGDEAERVFADLIRINRNDTFLPTLYRGPLPWWAQGIGNYDETPNVKRAICRVVFPLSIVILSPLPPLLKVGQVLQIFASAILNSAGEYGYARLE
jgi:hypothetical protein